MSRSSRRNVLIVVLGLGLVAVGVDRLLLAPPGAVAADRPHPAQVIPTGPGDAGVVAAADAPSATPPLHVILARRFEG